MVIGLAPVITMTLAEYDDDAKDEDKNGEDGDSNDIVLSMPP